MTDEPIDEAHTDAGEQRGFYHEPRSEDRRQREAERQKRRWLEGYDVHGGVGGSS